MKTGKIIKKNIKILLRSKVSTFVLIFIPLIVILLVGVSFNTSTFSLKIGSYSDQYSETSNQFIQKLDQKSFSVKRFDTNESCIDSVKDQSIHACIIFPPNMKISNNQINTVQFYVDQSKVNLVYFVMSTLEESFGELTT